MVKNRSPNINDAMIARIVEILDGWDEKLTWELLIKAIESRHYVKYTRQALHKHARITTAFTQLKKAPPKRREVQPVRSPELQAAVERITRLEAESRRLKAENDNLLEQFVRWAYNASVKGLGRDFLNRPLPPINRKRDGQAGPHVRSARDSA